MITIGDRAGAIGANIFAKAAPDACAIFDFEMTAFQRWNWLD
jgi:hypothetical protein